MVSKKLFLTQSVPEEMRRGSERNADAAEFDDKI
jgi:hypothetical protein